MYLGTPIKAARAFWHGFLLCAGASFWVLSWLDLFRMEYAFYGVVSNAAPTWVWAAALMGASSAYLWALWVNGRKWFTPLVRAICGVIIFAKFSSFAVSALPVTGFGVVVVFAFWFAVAEAVLLHFDAREAGREWEAWRRDTRP